MLDMGQHSSRRFGFALDRRDHSLSVVDPDRYVLRHGSPFRNDLKPYRAGRTGAPSG
jgi:hypothetical protein